MNSNKTELQELLRLKEIVKWQITIAKDYKILELREKQLKEINQQIEKLTQNKSQTL